MSQIDTTIDLLHAGIKAEHMRQKAIASNVANIETPGYRRVDINFEEAMAKAIDKEGNFEPENAEAEFYNPKNTPIRANGNDVNLDAEIGHMVQNTLKHKTYVLLLKKQAQRIEMAYKTP